MLIRFFVDNFLSFREEQEFSMLPGRSYQHPHHIIKGDDGTEFSLLRMAAIFGKNASGKSNFINAVEFARNLIIDGPSTSGTIPVRPFRLDRKLRSKPSRFQFQIHINGRSFDYGFSVNRKEVVEEWLYEIRKSSEKVLFERKANKIELGEIDYSVGLKESDKVTTEKQAEQRLVFVGEDTRDNQLFLSAT